MLLKEQTMAAGDPTVLLDAMGMMLGEFGNIRSPQDVSTVISLMKDAEKLLNRCIFLNILRATVESAHDVSLETVQQFVKDGGCAILNKWLADAKDLENLPLTLEVLELLEAMPITIEALKQGNIGKLVKQLTKSEEKEIKELASNLLDKWMVLVKGKPKKSKKTEGTSDEPDPNNSQTGSPTMKRSRENSTEDKKPKQPPEKKVKSLSEAKSNVTSVAKPPVKTLSEAKNNVTSVAKPPVKAKVIPALPKPIVMECTGFMNALIQQTLPKIPKKKKKVAPPPPSPKDKPSYSGPLEEILQNQSQTHGDEKEKGEKEKEKVENIDEKEIDDDEKIDNESEESQDEPLMSSTPVIESSTETTDNTTTTAGPEPDVTPSSSEIEITVEVKEKPNEPVELMETNETEVKKDDEQDVLKSKKKKKSITWAEDDKLLQYHYYEPDDQEEKVQHVVNFHDAQHQEAMKERQRVVHAKRLSEDKMMEKQIWYRPTLFAASELMEPGENSEEKFNQKERESKILPDLFFSKSSLPISAREPEPEANTGPPSQPLVIPHDEKGSVYPPSKGAVNVFAVPPVETSTSIINAVPSLPPALAALLANTGKLQGNQVNPAGTNPALANVDVQELLTKLMGSAQSPEVLEESAKRLQHEFASQRFPLMNHMLRIPGRPPGEQGLHPMSQELPRHGLPPDFRPRGGLLRAPCPPDHARFPGPHRGGSPRGRFHPPGGPRMRHPMPGGPRMPGGMARGGLINRFQVPDGNREPGDQYFPDGENPDGHNMMGPRGRGMRGRGRGRPMCRHFMSPRGCLRANNCPFLHPGVNAPPV